MLASFVFADLVPLLSYTLHSTAEVKKDCFECFAQYIANAEGKIFSVYISADKKVYIYYLLLSTKLKKAQTISLFHDIVMPKSFNNFCYFSRIWLNNHLKV